MGQTTLECPVGPVIPAAGGETLPHIQTFLQSGCSHQALSRVCLPQVLSGSHTLMNPRRSELIENQTNDFSVKYETILTVSNSIPVSSAAC